MKARAAMGPMPMRALMLALMLALALVPASSMSAAAEGAQRLDIDDLFAVRDVGEPRLSPDGTWVAFTVTQDHAEEDKRLTELWVARVDGSGAHRLPVPQDDSGTLGWTPDGAAVTFLSGQNTANGRTQLWRAPLSGADAVVVTQVDGDVTGYAWGPDGHRVVLVVNTGESSTVAASPDGKPIPAPIVIDRYYFKEDVTGYLGHARQHLVLADLASHAAVALTQGAYDEVKPSWSPDGTRIAFASKRGDDPDRHDTYGLYLMAPAPGAEQHLLVTYQGTTYQGDAASDWAGPPAWSPDGRSIAYVTAGDPKLIYYSIHQLAIVPSAGGMPRFVAPALDRNVSGVRWSRDGRSLLALVEDDRSSHLIRVDAATGAVTALLAGERNTSDFDVSGDALVVLDSSPAAPAEVQALHGHTLRPLSRQNGWLARVRLAPVQEREWRSADGTQVHGLLTLPTDHVAGRRSGVILRLHGGPTSQFANEFDFEQQLLAAAGYAVLSPNPRGSAGRGEAYAAAIYADWGNKDVADVLAGIDDLVASGVADPARLGVGGWSYGGMLTNYTIARDTRFKAAVSGAALSNQTAAYGTDMYVREYEAEIGPPWMHPETWLKVSFPFFHADRITTPTLFMCGTLDYSVPLLHSEQMYQALRSLGRDTRLVVYPGQSHSFVRPSFRLDRLRRSLDWYQRHLGS